MIIDNPKCERCELRTHSYEALMRDYKNIKAAHDALAEKMRQIDSGRVYNWPNTYAVTLDEKAQRAIKELKEDDKARIESALADAACKRYQDTGTTVLIRVQRELMELRWRLDKAESEIARVRGERGE